MGVMDKFSKKQKEPEVLVESWSPVCDIQAFAEESDSCVYFYLWRDPGSDHAQVKSCWVCNTAPAPDDIDEAAMVRAVLPEPLEAPGGGPPDAQVRLRP